MVDLIAVRFRPEALGVWLRTHAGELADAQLGFSEVAAPLERTLPERLADLGGRERLAMLTRYLARSAAGSSTDRRLSAAVDMMLGSARARPDGVARAAGMSRRQLGRLFRERVGLGPGILGRLGRFQRALRTLDSDPAVSLAGAAARAGYFDQAHMNRDFRLFAGVTPAGYRRERRDLTRNFLDTSE